MKIGEFASAHRVILITGAEGTASEIWEVRCILVGMLTGRPRFAGTHGVDQLDRVHRLLSSSSPKILLAVNSQKGAHRLVIGNAKLAILSWLPRLLTYVASDGKTISPDCPCDEPAPATQSTSAAAAPGTKCRSGTDG
jgi:hypothetical protein